MLVRLPASALKEYTRIMLMQQKHRCAICGKGLTEKDDAVVDHCHMSGALRGVLHRSCNGVEGKVLSAASSMTKGNGVAAVITIGERIQERLQVPRLYLPLFNIAARCHKGVTGSDYLVGLGKYYSDWQKPKHNLIHHSHHLPFERNTVENDKVNWRNKDGSMAKKSKIGTAKPMYK